MKNVKITFKLNGSVLAIENIESELSEGAVKGALHSLCLDELENEKYNHLTSQEKMYHIKNTAFAELEIDGVYKATTRIMQNYQGF